MKWADLKPIVAKAAPVVGTLIGGPAGAAVGGIVAAALGVDSTPEAVARAIQNDPDAAIKLAQLQSDERVTLQRLAADMALAELADVQNARSRDVDMRRAGFDNTRADKMILAAFVLLGGIILALLSPMLIEYETGLPETVTAVLSTMAGMLLKMLSDAYQFEFGSSRGSVAKTAMLEQKP